MSSRRRALVEAWGRERAAIFASAVGQPRSLLDSVRRRLMLVILIAVLPLASACMLQGLLQLRRAGEDAQQSLVQSAAAAAASARNIFSSAENVLQALKNTNDVRDANTDCQATLAGANLSVLFSSNIAYIDKNGQVLCSALPQTQSSVGDRKWWLAARNERGFTIGPRQISPVTRSDILVGILPLFGADGVFDGALAMAINAASLDNLLREAVPPSVGVVALINDKGVQVASNAADAASQLFDGRTIDNYMERLGEAKDAQGRAWSFAAAPLERHGLFVAIARPTADLFRWTTFHVLLGFVLPVVMVVFTLVAMWLATDRIVLQWLLYIRRVTVVYAQGHYGFRPTRMHRAPSEFRVLGHAIEDMALAVRERDNRLREGLAEKTALVREIHHRIKNSLQVVVSLLSLYGAGVAPADRPRFERLRVRMNSLAVVHRVFYEAAEGSEVRVRELLRELAVLLEGASDRSAAVLVEAGDEITLPTDFAVPLALLVTEIVMALTRPDAARPVRITLKAALQGGTFELVAEASEPAEGRLDVGKADLAHGFAGQLGGSVLVEEAEDCARIRTVFPARKRGMAG